jgi:RNA polymerase sigma-70 factor (ECF subfamily)
MRQPKGKTSANSADIPDLFRKIEQGERDALFELYDRTGGLLFGLTKKILGNAADAEEALLNIYTRIWQDPVSSGADYPLIAWLVMIARAHSLTRLYETRRSYTPAQTAAPAGSDKRPVANREQEDARVRFEALAPIQREILDWAFCSGLSAEGIAARTGMPAGAVKTHVRISLNRLSSAPEFQKTISRPANRREEPADESEGTAQ